MKVNFTKLTHFLIPFSYYPSPPQYFIFVLYPSPPQYFIFVLYPSPPQYFIFVLYLSNGLVSHSREIPLESCIFPWAALANQVSAIWSVISIPHPCAESTISGTYNRDNLSLLHSELMETIVHNCDRAGKL